MEIEDYKCLLPLSKNDEDLCPLGIAVSLNSQNQVKIEKMNITQPPSPMVILLTDNGLVVVYYALNLEAISKLICVPAAKLPFKNISSIQPGRLK